MNVFRFLFPYLYTRNWHTGESELSRPRVVLFCAMLALIFLGLIIAFILQTPVTYNVEV